MPAWLRCMPVGLLQRLIIAALLRDPQELKANVLLLLLLCRTELQRPACSFIKGEAVVECVLDTMKEQKTRSREVYWVYKLMMIVWLVLLPVNMEVIVSRDKKASEGSAQ